MSDKPITQYALKLYELMEAEADSEGVWRGSITRTFDTLNTSKSYYSPCTKLLVGVGAITLLQRGARGIESQYKLHGKPTEEELDGVVLTTARSSASLALEQRIADIEKRIGRLDIVSALSDLEKRVRLLETQGE